MGKCCSSVPTDYGELSKSDIEQKPTPRGTPLNHENHRKVGTKSIANGSSATSKPSTKKLKNAKYHKIFESGESQNEAVLDIPTLDGFNVMSTYYKDSISIDEHIVLEDMMKIYDPDKDEYVHYGVLLNHRQCRMYLFDPHHFAVWQQFERRTKMKDIFCSERNINNTSTATMTFTERDAKEMVQNLISSKAPKSSKSTNSTNSANSKSSNSKSSDSTDSVDTEYAVQFISGKTRSELQRSMLLPKEWNLTLSTLLKIDDKAIPKLVDHIVITQYEEDDIPSMLQFFRWNGLLIKHRFLHDDDEEELHLILLNEIERSSIKTMNHKLKQFMVSDDELDHNSCNIHIAPYYEQLNSPTPRARERGRGSKVDDVKVIDLQSRFVEVDLHNDYTHDDCDGFLYGFCMQSAVDEDDQNEEFLCILTDNNKVCSIKYTEDLML